MEKNDFDKNIMLEGYEKAKQVNEELKLNLDSNQLQNMATTFFINTMQTIREAKRNSFKREVSYK